MSKISVLFTLLPLICACQGEPDAPEGSLSTGTIADQTEFTVAGCCTLVLPRGFRPMEWNGIDTKGAIFENDEARIHVEYDVEPGIAINTNAQQHSRRKARSTAGRPGSTPIPAAKPRARIASLQRRSTPRGGNGRRGRG